MCVHLLPWLLLHYLHHFGTKLQMVLKIGYALDIVQKMQYAGCTKYAVVKGRPFTTVSSW